MDDYKDKADIRSSTPEEAFWAEVDGLALSLSAQMDYFEMIGAGALPAELFSSAAKAQPQPPSPASRPARSQAPKSAPPANISNQPGKPASQGDNQPSAWAPEASSLDGLALETSRCQACALAQIRQEEPFMGRGGSSPLLVVIGPTPTIFQDEKMALLTAIMEKGLELSSTEYFATSLVKCAPPDDQPPPKGADECCWPILKRQLTLLSPKAVLVLGKKPAQQITGLHNEPFGLIRPLTHKLEGLDAFIRVTYGLEDIMADQKIKKAAWQDLIKVKNGLKRIK